MFEKSTSKSKNEYVWAFKHAPKVIDDLILLDRQKNKIKNIIESKNLPDLLLYGLHGVGKTTLANVLINELDLDALYINGSRDTSIDIVRTDIKNFTSRYSSKHKLVFIDEMEGISPQAQKSLKSEMELCKKTAFMFTSNHKENIIDPIISRCGGGMSFNYTTKEKKELYKLYMIRCMQIMDSENVEYDKKAVAKVIQTLFPDMRNIIHNLQDIYNQYEKISIEAVESLVSVDLKKYFELIKSKNFSKIRSYCVNLNSDPVMFYNQIVMKVENYVDSSSIGDVINECYEHQKTASQSADKILPLIRFSMLLTNMSLL